MGWKVILLCWVTFAVLLMDVQASSRKPLQVTIQPREIAGRLASRILQRIYGLSEEFFSGGSTPVAEDQGERVARFPTAADLSEASLANGVEPVPFVLIHGAIQGGWVWEYPTNDAPRGVKGFLEGAGHRVFNPTLPHHDRAEGWSAPSDLVADAFDYVKAITNVLTSNNLTNAVLVAHSLSGVWTQLAAQEMPERISSLIFANAIVLSTGESFFTNRVGGLGAVPLHALFTAVFGAPVWPLEPDTPLGFMEKDAWQTVFMNTRENDERLVEATYNLLMPEPRTPEMQDLDFDSFYSQPLPKHYMYFDQDLTMIQPEMWLRFRDRLANDSNNAGVPMRTMTVYGDHQAMITQPRNVAAGLLEMVYGLHDELAS